MATPRRVNSKRHSSNDIVNQVLDESIKGQKEIDFMVWKTIRRERLHLETMGTQALLALHTVLLALTC